MHERNGGNAFFSYVWSPPVGNSYCVTNLPAGTYCVIVTDMNGCTADTCVTVNEPQQLTVTGSSFPSTCGNCNGAATVIPFGGTAPYAYTWDGFGVPSFNNLCAGTYIYTITDANGCVDSISVIINDVPGPTIDSISTTDVTCNGICDGIATASVSGGTFPLTYSWSNGDITATADSLCAGTHTITVTDLNGCVAIDSVIINEPDVLLLTAFGAATICVGDSTVITANASGGDGGPYTYTWNNGAGTGNPVFVSPASTTTYVVTVSDACGSPVAIDSVTITVNPELVLIPTSANICPGESVVLNVSGALSYWWIDETTMDTLGTGPTITVNPSVTTNYLITGFDGVCWKTDTVTVIVEICSGVDEPDALKGISVYPNPNTGEFVIEMHILKAQDVQIKIVNVLGQEVYTEIVAMTTGIYRKQIDLASYPRGIYTLQIITDDGLFNKKVIVE